MTLFYKQQNSDSNSLQMIKGNVNELTLF